MEAGTLMTPGIAQRIVRKIDVMLPEAAMKQITHGCRRH
jgi:hypothetical protein